ncbi:MAG TPA: ankyrin repeat domain-containing protein [Longimicrobiales bacterium]
MPGSKLPDNASLEYLKKLAKERLRELRRAQPDARLASAQLDVARAYGFPSWRALRAELDRRRAAPIDALFRACSAGDVDAVRGILARQPQLARERAHGTTALHRAAAHASVLRVLLEHGADPNVRDEGDNALPLHFAAGGGFLESVRALLDAGSDVHGFGDLHEGDVIGWAACGHEPHREIVQLLLERGARHHIFSAMAMADADLARRLVEEDPRTLERRTSRFESLQTPIHFALFAPDGLGGRRVQPQYDMLDVLIELGADVDMEDGRGRTALELAMLRGDTEAIRRLRAAGARDPEIAADDSPEALAALGSSIRQQLTPMLAVSDMSRSLRWYAAIGFRITESHGQEDSIDWAHLTLGGSGIMVVPGGQPGHKQVSLWFTTDRLDDLHAALRARQLRHARATGGGAGEEPAIRFVQDLYEAFYGQREFCIEDPDGYELWFAQPLSRP